MDDEVGRSGRLLLGSVKAGRLLAVLMRSPLNYQIVRQNGSHRTLRSTSGYPDLVFAFHEGVTLPPRMVKKILVGRVGLTEDQARELL